MSDMNGAVECVGRQELSAEILTAAQAIDAVVLSSEQAISAGIQPGVIIGERGPQGIQGLKGDTGSPGASAYVTARAGGYSGTEAAFASDLAAIEGLASLDEALSAL